MSAVNSNGNQTYWLNGEAFQAIKKDKFRVGNNTFYVNGEPNKELFPITNDDTGKFFILFE